MKKKIKLVRAQKKISMIPKKDVNNLMKSTK